MAPITSFGSVPWNNAHAVWNQTTIGPIPLADIALDGFDAYNDQTNQVMGYLGQILSQAKGRPEARAYGNNWSFSKTAATTGYLFQTQTALKFYSPIQTLYVDPNSRFKGKEDNLLFLQCGNHLYDIHTILDGLDNPKSLPVSGSSCDQTIAGAFSTGTHGSALNGGGGIKDKNGNNWGGGAVHDYVRGLHLILGPDRHVFLQRESDLVLTTDFGNLIKVANADFIVDDDMFNAALVGFGSFGFIHGVLLEVVDRYTLHNVRYFYSAGFYDPGLQASMTQLNIPSDLLKRNTTVLANLLNPGDPQPYHFEVFRNPQAATPGQEMVIQVMDQMTYSDDYPFPDPNLPPVQNVNSDASWIGNFLGTNLAMNTVFNTMYVPFDFYGTIGQCNPQLGLPGTGSVVLSVAIDMARVIDVMRLADKARTQFPNCYIWHDLRYVPQSKGFLGFQRFPHNCTFEIAGIGSQNVISLINYFLALMKDAGIMFAFHWGKYLPLGPAETHYGGFPAGQVNGLAPYILDQDELVRLYGDDLANWKKQKAALFGDPKLEDLFRNDLMRSLGL